LRTLQKNEDTSGANDYGVALVVNYKILATFLQLGEKHRNLVYSVDALL
jgi:hypothetical protein